MPLEIQVENSTFIKIVDMLRILSYGLPDPGHRVLTAQNGMSKKLCNGQNGSGGGYGYRSRVAT